METSFATYTVKAQRISTARFHSAITQFVADTGATPSVLADTTGRPVSTVYKWLAGKQAPSRKELPAICAKFNWNYKDLFSSEVLIDRVIHQNFLSFEALNSRYMKLRELRPMEALKLVYVGGAMGFAYLTDLGLEVEFLINYKTRTVIKLINEPCFEGINVLVAGNASNGLQIALFLPAINELSGKWEPLNEAGLRACYEVLMVKKELASGVRN